MLEIRDLHVRFHNRDREAVSGVSLTIRDGEILGLVGESGSGKSVTAMSVAGLLPRKQCDYSGEILLDGQELLHADRAALRKIQGADIGVVFQEPQSCMDPLMRIGAQVEEALRLHTQLSRAECREAALAAMRAAELPDPEGVYEKYPHQLSGGMLQRAMIAAAIVNRPKLLLLDEPTTALDVTIGNAEKAEPGERHLHAVYLPQPQCGPQAVPPRSGDAAGRSGGKWRDRAGLLPSPAPLYQAAH